MPTSRYWLQAFCSISTDFSFIASGEPGLSFEKSSPTSRTTSLRIASAEAGLPRARSSITRSSIEIAKVTPAAFRTCRSSGASSQGFVRSRRSGGVLATMLSRSPIRVPAVPRSASAGLASSHSALTVENRALTSKTPSLRTATTAGPARSGIQTRPTSVPLAPSSGRTSFAVSVIIFSSPLVLDRCDIRNRADLTTRLCGAVSRQSSHQPVREGGQRRLVNKARLVLQHEGTAGGTHDRMSDYEFAPHGIVRQQRLDRDRRAHSSSRRLDREPDALKAAAALRRHRTEADMVEPAAPVVWPRTRMQ